MSDQPFRVIVEGHVREGHERDLVIENLSRLFKLDSDAAERLISGRPKIVKRTADAEEAARYKRVIEKAGAACRIESDARKESVPGKEEIANSFASEHDVCPMCGYSQTTDEALPFVEGECPRCGVIRGKLSRPGGEAAVSQPDAEPLSGDFPIVIELPHAGSALQAIAPWDKRVLASIHTFSLFGLAYLGLLFLLLALYAPRAALSFLTDKDFVDTMIVVYPAVLAVLSLIVVSVVIPLLNGGRSLGQSIVGIELLDISEDKSRDVYSLLTIRTACAALISFVPGIVVNWIGSAVGLIDTARGTVTAMVVMAILSWGACWINVALVADGRGIIDRSTGTVQVGADPLTSRAVITALIPGSILLAILLLPRL